MSSGGYEHLYRISLADALAEPEHERLSFDRRPPSPATAAALARVPKPELLASDMQQLKTKRRPRAA
jgi:hypothetical protein